MPNYEYRCPSGHRFERLQRVGDAAPACPVCGAETVRVITPVGVIFKGAGFHATDYRRASGDGKDGDGPSEAKTTPTPAPSTSTKTES